MAFVPLEPGSFEMGSPADEPGRLSDETLHSVTLTHGFWMQSTPVTQAQWQALMGNNPSWFVGEGHRPVEQVSWYDALAFANALSRAVGLYPAYDLGTCTGVPGTKTFSCLQVSLPTDTPYATGGFRLPTEAEWEYAYRAGSSTAFYNGPITGPDAADAVLDQIGWYNHNSGSTTHPVGQLQPNAWGLFDMAGNVWQLCGDYYGPYPAGPVVDPTGSINNPNGSVSRGGSWLDTSQAARAASRGKGFSKANWTGFRLARTR
jgi:formylglycine-generating enzyme required for sulfatase activity